MTAPVHLGEWIYRIIIIILQVKTDGPGLTMAGRREDSSYLTMMVMMMVGFCITTMQRKKTPGGLPVERKKKPGGLAMERGRESGGWAVGRRGQLGCWIDYMVYQPSGLLGCLPSAVGGNMGSINTTAPHS